MESYSYYVVIWIGKMVKRFSALFHFKRSAYKVILPVLLIGYIFDMATPLGIAAGVIYVIPILMTYNYTSDRVTYITALSAVTLVLIGYVFSPDGGELVKVIANRLLAVIAIVAVAFAIIKVKHQKVALVEQTKLAKEAEMRAISASRAKSVFLSSMSHELRTPLNAIMGFSQLLKLDSELTGDQNESASYIYDSGVVLLDLVTNVLEFTELQDAAVTHTLSSFNIDSVVVEVIDTLSPLAGTKGVRIDTDKLLASKMKNVYSDPDAIRSVISHMLKNAIQYNKDNGLVLISSKVNNGALLISISDTGHGIEEAKSIEVFKPFSRLGQENSTSAGMGLGLAQAKVLIESLHGRIGFHSSKQGTTFWIEIPYEQVI